MQHADLGAGMIVVGAASRGYAADTQMCIHDAQICR